MVSGAGSFAPEPLPAIRAVLVGAAVAEVLSPPSVRNAGADGWQ